MPAGPIGSCWASGSWEDTNWEDGSWEDQGAGVATVLRDLQTLWHIYQGVRHAAMAVGAVRDDTTLIAAHKATAQFFDSENDANTGYAKYIETNH